MGTLTLFGWAGDRWKPLKIDLVLLQEQKEWLYRERALIPRSNADQKTNGYDAEMLDGILDYNAEMLDGILEMLECIQDAAKMAERKEVKEMSDESTVNVENIADRDVGDETLECEGCGRFYGLDQVLDADMAKKYPKSNAKGQCPECGGLVYVKKVLDAKMADLDAK